jgi:hypothetical protein
MPSNLQSSFSLQTTPFNANEFTRQGGDRYNLGSDVATSMNKQLIDGYVNRGLSGLLASGDVGVYTSTKVDSFDFGRFLRLIPDFATKFNLVSNGVELAKSNNLMDLGTLSPLGPALEYIPVDNHDGLRKFGWLMYDNDTRQNQFRIRIDQATIDGTEAIQEVPTDDGLIAADVTTIYLSPNNSYINELKSGCASCQPNSCAKGYRQLFLIKNTNPAFGGVYQAGSTVTETLIVLDVKDPGDGGLILEVIRGANRKTQVGENNITFNSGAVDITEGDFLMVGTFTPTTECLGSNLKCQYIQPKIHTYCSSIKEFTDCIACVTKSQFKTRQSHEIISRKEQLALSIVNNLKTFYHRSYNEFIWGDENYAQLQPAPAHPNPAIDFGKGDNGELIPSGIKGIMKQFDLYARELEITFTSCEQQCWEYQLTTLIEALDAGREGGSNAAPYTDAGWMMVGDIEGLDGIYKSRFFNQLAFNQDGIEARNTAVGLTYDNSPVSLFSDDKNNAPNARKLKNEFDRMANDYGIQMAKLQIGKYTFRALHDRALADLEPGVIRLMYIPDITFFTDNQDDTMDGIFGGMSPFMRASAITGRLAPNIRSDNYLPVHLNGKIQMMSANDCPMSWYAYMRAGVHIKARNLPRSIKITLNSLKPNPGAGDPYIKDTIYALDCGCMRAKKDVINTLETWANGNIQNGPII